METFRIRIPNVASERHLARVRGIMRRRGSPRIRCALVRGSWVALEGSHRITAAHQLGVPIIVVRKRLRDTMRNDVINCKSTDTVNNIVAELLSWGAAIYIEVKATVARKRKRCRSTE